MNTIARRFVSFNQRNAARSKAGPDANDRAIKRLIKRLQSVNWFSIILHADRASKLDQEEKFPAIIFGISALIENTFSIKEETTESKKLWLFYPSTDRVRAKSLHRRPRANTRKLTKG